MKKLLGALALTLPVASFGATYAGKISMISINDKDVSAVFEVVDRNNDKCPSSWFEIKKPDSNELTSGSLIMSAYYNKERVTIDSPSACATASEPGLVNSVSVGVSNEEMEASKQKYREAKKDKK